MAAEGLAGVHVGEVDFDKGFAGGSERIAQGDAGVGVGCRVDDDEGGMVGHGRLGTLKQHGFGIALHGFKGKTGSFGARL